MSASKSIKPICPPGANCPEPVEAASYRLVKWQCDRPDHVETIAHYHARDLVAVNRDPLLRAALPSFGPGTMVITEIQQRYGDDWRPSPKAMGQPDQSPDKRPESLGRFRPMTLFVIDSDAKPCLRYWSFFAALSSRVISAATWEEARARFVEYCPGPDDAILVKDEEAGGFAKGIAQLLKGIGFTGRIYVLAKQRKHRRLMEIGCTGAFSRVSDFLRELQKAQVRLRIA